MLRQRAKAATGLGSVTPMGVSQPVTASSDASITVAPAPALAVTVQPAVPQMLWGECISGALYVNDFLDLTRRVGFADPRELHVRENTP